MSRRHLSGTHNAARLSLSPARGARPCMVGFLQSGVVQRHKENLLLRHQPRALESRAVGRRGPIAKHTAALVARPCCCAMLCYVCCAMLCYAVLCCALLCYDVLCCACCAMLCYARAARSGGAGTRRRGRRPAAAEACLPARTTRPQRATCVYGWRRGGGWCGGWCGGGVGWRGGYEDKSMSHPLGINGPPGMDVHHIAFPMHRRAHVSRHSMGAHSCYASPQRHGTRRHVTALELVTELRAHQRAARG